MQVVRLTLVMVVMLVVMGPQCGQKENAQPSQAASVPMRCAVHGIVSGSPPKGMPPASPRVLGDEVHGSAVAGARVALRRFEARDAAAGPVMASAVTDSTGAYRLDAPPGTYFLVVSQAAIPYAMYTSGYFDRNFAPADSINAYRVLELTADVEENIVLPQAWPE